TAYWAFGDFGASVISPAATHCYNNPGDYSLNLITTDPQGCKSSLIVPNYVKVYGAPKADYIYEPEFIDLNNGDVKFKNSSVNASQLYWVLDGKLLSTKQTVDHTFLAEGCYNLKLIAANEDLCVDTADRQICVSIGF